MASWEGKVATLREAYEKDAEDLTVVERLELSWMESRGKIVTNASAEYVNTTVKKAEPPVEGHAEAATIDFSRRNLWDQARQGWRGQVATDLMYRHERMEAKGDIVIVNRFSKMLANISTSLRHRLHEDLYCDGGTAANALKIEGLRTFTGHSTANTEAADKVAYPSDTYRNILCSPGQEGTWSEELETSPNAALDSDWPDGQGSSEYHYWTPLLLKSDSTQYGDGGGWDEECEEILTDLNLWMRLIRDTSGSELVLATDGRMNAQFKSKMRARNYHLMPLKAAVDLGFPDVLNYEGMGIYASYALPANTGIVWNFEHVQLASVAPTLLFSDGPDWSIEKQAWLVLMGFYGNLISVPRYFAEIQAFATS